MKSLWIGAAMVFSAGMAEAACLEVRNDQMYGGWINHCNVTISVVWNDQKYCTSTVSNVYPCAATVGPGAWTSDHTYGYVSWHECQSPGGAYAVQAIERGYGEVFCVD